MSDPLENPPPLGKHWFFTLLKWIFYLIAGTIVLAVLAFGTCLLLFRH